MFPKLKPLTPNLIPPTDMGKMSHSELIIQNLDLKHKLSAERRTNTKAQRALVDYLDTLQKMLNEVRELYMTTIALKPGPSDKERS